MMETIGFLELNSIAKGVEVADIVLKTAAVDLVFSRSGCPGKYYLLFTGEVAAVKASIDAGINTPAAEGMLVSSVVIPSPHPGLLDSLM